MPRHWLGKREALCLISETWFFAVILSARSKSQSYTILGHQVNIALSADSLSHSLSNTHSARASNCTDDETMDQSVRLARDFFPADLCAGPEASTSHPARTTVFEAPLCHRALGPDPTVIALQCIKCADKDFFSLAFFSFSSRPPLQDKMQRAWIRETERGPLRTRALIPILCLSVRLSARAARNKRVISLLSSPSLKTQIKKAAAPQPPLPVSPPHLRYL